MADGSVRRASADENADLFWAIRGGGGNFGIAASLEYDAAPGRPDDHRRPRRAPAAERRGDVLRFFRDTCATLPDEMMMVAGLLTAPDGSGRSSSASLAGALRIAGRRRGGGEAASRRSVRR